MRSDLAADFLTEMARNGAEPFLTAVIGGNPASLYIADRGVTIGGNVHDVIVPAGGFGVFESLVQGSISRSLDIGAADLKVTNQPVLKHSPYVGWRVSDALGPIFAARPFTIYQNFKKADGTLATQAPLFAGYIRNPATFDYVRDSLRAVSMRDYYCSRPVLKVFDETNFLWMDRADIGSTLPIGFGQVRGAPGRIIKRSIASFPTAAVGNSTTASLDSVFATALAVAETWTLLFSAPETIAFTGTTDTDNLVGDTTTPRTCYAQSFQTVGAQTLTGVTLTLKAPSAGGGSVGAYVYCCADAAGVPGAVLGHASRGFTNTTYGDWTFSWGSSITIGAATKFWIVVRAWGTYAGGTAYWASASAGGFAGGNGKHGTYPASDDYKAPSSGLPTITWDTTRDAHDFRFICRFASASGAYSITGSVTGADGTGTTATNAISTSGKVFIYSSAWKGTPAAGDTFTFKTDPAYPSIVLFGQANATNLSATSWLQRIYLDDMLIGLQGASAVSITTTTTGLDIGPTTTQIGQAIKLAQTGVLKKVWFSLKKTGTPSSSLWCAVYETDGTGTVPSTGAAPLAIVNVSAAAVTTSYALVAFDFSTYGSSIVLDSAKTYAYVLLDLTSPTTANCFTCRYGAYTGGTLCFKTKTADWTYLSGQGVAMQIDLATFFPSQSGPNIAPYGWGATGGVPVLFVYADVSLPAATKKISADLLTGIVDDSGTITGTAFASITVPDHVFHWLANNAGAPDANIDLAGSFANANVKFGGVYLFNGLVQDQMTYDALFAKLGRECRCSPDWPVDKLQLNWLKDASDAPVATFTPAQIVADAATGLLLLSFEWSNTKEIVNSIDARYSRDPRLPQGQASSYRRSHHEEDGASIVIFGKQEVPTDYFYDFVDSAQMATALSQYAIARQSLPKRLGRVTMKLPQFALQKTDNVAFAIT